MHKKTLAICLSFTLLFSAPFLTGCSGSTSSAKSDNSTSMSLGSSKSKNHSDDKKRTTVKEYLLPSASGSVVYGNDIVSIDASNISEGYVMIKHQGGVDKVKLQDITYG